jgi:DNA-3-methyladenine glycosylase
MEASTMAHGLGKKVRKILPRSFYERETDRVAQELLGKIIVRVIDAQTVLMGRIVETEAYMGITDLASHAYGGKRIRNAPLYGPVGHAYVYFIYGMYNCINFVSRAKDVPAGGVLIRALEPLEGIEYMKAHRHTNILRALTSGPGKLTKAFSITRVLNEIDVTKKGALYVIDAPSLLPKDIIASPRIGLSKGREPLLRYYIKDNPFVSKR